MKWGAQAGAERVQISTVGSIQNPSSIVPAFRNANSGSDSIVLNIGEPQAEQNRRSVLLSYPSLMVLKEASDAPSTVSADRGTPTITENAVAVWRWQSAQ